MSVPDEFDNALSNSTSASSTHTHADTLTPTSAAAIAHNSYTDARSDLPAFLHQSTFDPSQPRRLVEVPRGLGFSAASFDYQSRQYQVEEEEQDLDESSMEEEDTEEDESIDDAGESDRLYTGTGGESEAVDSMHRALSSSSASAARAVSTGRLTAGDVDTTLYGSTPSSRRASTSTSRQALSSNTPLLSGGSSSASPFASPPLIQSSTPGPSVSFAGSDSFQPFTPQTRRSYLRKKIDLVKMQNAEKRKAFLCWKENPFTKRRIILLGLLAAIALSYASEMVLRKVTTSHLYNYRWFLFEFTSLITFIICLALAFIHKDAVQHFLKHHGFPFKFFFFSSMLDAIHTMALLLAIGVLPPLWGVLVPQLVIPFSLLFRFFVTNGMRGGDKNATFGSLMIVAAVLLSFIPTLEGYETCESLSVHATKKQVRSELIINLMILTIGLVPNAVSNIYKQSYCQHHSMNMYLMNAVLAGLSFFWGIVLSPLALSLQYQGSTGLETGVPLYNLDGSPVTTPTPSPAKSDLSQDLHQYEANVHQDFTTNFKGGWDCLLGKDSEVGDTCQNMYPYLFIATIVFLATQAVTQALLFYLMSRERKERIVSASLTAGVVMALFLFQLPFINDSWLPSWEIAHCIPSWHWSVWVGALFIVIGMTMGQWEPAQEPMDLDVWARLEEIAEQEEIEKNRRARATMRVSSRR